MKDNELLTKILKVNKLILILLIVIVILLTLGVSKMYYNENTNTEETTESEYNTNYDVSMFEEIASKDIKSKTKKDTKVIYIGRESCGWCAAFLPNLWEAQKEFDYKTLYIDLAKIIDFSTGEVIDQKQFDILNSLTGENYEKYMEENLGTTPMVLIVNNNKILSASTGYMEYDGFKTVLNNGGIK